MTEAAQKIARPSKRRAALMLVALGQLLLVLAVGCGGGGSSRQTVSRLSGLVATIDTGTPVINALVTVDGTSRATRTTVRGSYFLDAVGVSEGWHTVRAETQIGGQIWTGERAVLFDRNILVQSNLLITVGPENRKGTIRGRVTTASGAPLRNVTVFLNPETNVAAAFRITNSDGQDEFRGVPAGTYTVVASARDLVNSGVNQVLVTPATTSTVNLSMLIASGVSIAAPTGLEAQAFTYPESAVGVQARTRAVAQWLRARRGGAVKAHTSQRFRVQDWPAGSIIEASLSWVPPSANDLAGYVLDRAVGGGGFGTINRFADPTATAYNDLDPIYTPEQSYQFRLSAVSTSGVQSGLSNVATARPLEPLGGLSPAFGAAVTSPPTFSWQPVTRAQSYQVLVLSRRPEVTDVDRMPLVWPAANNLAAGQISGTQLTYGGPALQAGTTYYWLVFAFDQLDTNAAQAVSASDVQAFSVR